MEDGLTLKPAHISTITGQEKKIWGLQHLSTDYIQALETKVTIEKISKISPTGLQYISEECLDNYVRDCDRHHHSKTKFRIDNALITSARECGAVLEFEALRRRLSTTRSDDDQNMCAILECYNTLKANIHFQAGLDRFLNEIIQFQIDLSNNLSNLPVNIKKPVQFKEIESLLLDALTRHSNHYQATLELAKLYERHEHHDKAYSHWMKVLSYNDKALSDEVPLKIKSRHQAMAIQPEPGAVLHQEQSDKTKK